MVIIDSNVWIAFLNKNDSNHKRADEIFNKLVDKREKIIITEYVLLEIVTVLSQKVGKKIANQFIEIAGNTKRIEIISSSADFLDEVLAFYLKQKNKNLSFVDYSLLYLSGQYEVLTFDKKLNSLLSKSERQ